MPCDRRRENKNCLALVSSKVIYFQKLTESHCRGFIYFYSECHYSVIRDWATHWSIFPQTWTWQMPANVWIVTWESPGEIFWGLLVLRCSALVPGQMPQFEDGLSDWHVRFQILVLSYERKHASCCCLIICSLYPEAKEGGVALLVSHLFIWATPEFLETQKPSCKWVCFESMYCLYLNWLTDALIQIICTKLWNFVFACFVAFSLHPLFFFFLLAINS